MEHIYEETASKDLLWKQRLQHLCDSGLTQKAWCEQNQIPLTTLRYWKRKLSTKREQVSHDMGWFPIETDSFPVDLSKTDVIVKKAGIQIVISDHADPVLCQNLLQILLNR